MKIKILILGSLKKDFTKIGLGHFLKRTKKHHSIEIQEIKEVKITKNSTKEVILRDEALRIKDKINTSSSVIALTETGKQYSSQEFAGFLQKQFNASYKEIVFIIGSAHGLDQSILQMANHKLSLSKMTLPHELAIVFLLEQIYRGFSILNNEPYSSY